MAPIIAGIFVGGQGSRLGGVAKGLLEAKGGEPIVSRTKRILEDAGCTCVLVGAPPSGSAPEYAELKLDMIADDPIARGPLAGLLALFAYATTRPAIAIACDMPLLGHGIVRRLIDEPPAPIVAPRRTLRHDGSSVWEPLCARYDAMDVMPIARSLAQQGKYKLQLLLDMAGTRVIELSDVEAASLEDWDTPDDLPAGHPRGRR